MHARRLLLTALVAFVVFVTLAGLPRQAWASPGAVVDAVIAEALAVAAAEGVALPWATPAAYQDEFYGRLVPATFDHRSSMLQDLERGRRTEIDAITGEVWRRGERHGISTPTAAALTRLVHLAERPPHA